MVVVASHAILTTTNEFVNKINIICSNKMPDDKMSIASAYYKVKPDDVIRYPVKYITSLQDSTIIIISIVPNVTRIYTK